MLMMALGAARIRGLMPSLVNVYFNQQIDIKCTLHTLLIFLDRFPKQKQLGFVTFKFH